MALPEVLTSNGFGGNRASELESHFFRSLGRLGKAAVEAGAFMPVCQRGADEAPIFETVKALPPDSPRLGELGIKPALEQEHVPHNSCPNHSEMADFITVREKSFIEPRLGPTEKKYSPHWEGEDVDYWKQVAADARTAYFLAR